MSRLRDNVERWLIHENYDFKQGKSDDATFKIIINNYKYDMKTKQLIRFRELNETEQENFKKKVDDFCYSIKAVGKFLDEDGKKKVGVYIVLDKPEQLNQPSFFKALEEIIEMSEKTNRFLIKTF